MEVPKRVEGAKIEIPTPDKWLHDGGEASVVGGSLRRERHPGVGNQSRLEPGKAFPFAPLFNKIVLERRQAHGRWPRVPIRAQPQVNSKDKPVFGDRVQ